MAPNSKRQKRSADPRQPIFLTECRDIGQQQVNDLTQRQRQDREIDAHGSAQRDDSHDESHERTQQPRSGEEQQWMQLRKHLGGPRECITANGEERRMAEADKTGLAEHQVPAQPEHDVQHEGAGNEHDALVGDEGEQHENHQGNGGDEGVAAPVAAACSGHHRRAPAIKPCGRASSMTAMAT